MTQDCVSKTIVRHRMNSSSVRWPEPGFDETLVEARRFSVLGPLEVRGANGLLQISGPKPRAMLAVLLLHRNQSASGERLALALWGVEAGREAVKNVRVNMSRLRRALGDPARVATTPCGYRLHVRHGELDVDVFEELVSEGRAALAHGRFADAAALLREGLSLWRGLPLAEFADEPFAIAEIARLEDRQLAAIESRVTADLGCGRHEALTAELRGLVVEHPTRERFVALLMLTLYRCSRQAEALDAYRQAWHRLDRELGILPGSALRRLQEAILRHDATLDSPSALSPHAPAQQGEPAPSRSSAARAALLPGLASAAGVARFATLVGHLEEMFSCCVSEDERRSCVELLVRAAEETRRNDMNRSLAPAVVRRLHPTGIRHEVAS